jgi:hypothetical protein
MQRELAKLIEHFYQQEVEYDDDLQLLTSRAYDDVRELTERVRDLESLSLGDDTA